MVYIIAHVLLDICGLRTAFSYDMSNVREKKSLRYVAEACGGTLTFEGPYSEHDDLSNDEGKHIPLVGVSKCIFCVGVYFKISVTQAFCAHIQACRDP